eukprot:7309121-Pyramimonas_sp.AAC.1
MQLPARRDLAPKAGARGEGGRLGRAEGQVLHTEAAPSRAATSCSAPAACSAKSPTTLRATT